MRSLVILSVAVLGLSACGGGGGTKARLEASCQDLAKMSGETPPKGACKCMSNALVETLSKEDAKAVADAFSKMDKPEDAAMAMLPLIANGKIMMALAAVEKKCDME